MKQIFEGSLWTEPKYGEIHYHIEKFLPGGYYRLYFHRFKLDDSSNYPGSGSVTEDPENEMFYRLRFTTERDLTQVLRREIGMRV